MFTPFFPVPLGCFHTKVAYHTWQMTNVGVHGTFVVAKTSVPRGSMSCFSHLLSCNLVKLCHTNSCRFPQLAQM